MRRHRVVCWLRTKWTIFDLQLCSSWGQAASWAHWEEEAGEASPKGVGKSPSGLSSSWGECAQVLLRDSPWRGSQRQTSFNGEVRESSWPTGPRARWHITASLCAAIPRMRHSGVGKFASDQQGEGWGVIASPNAGGGWGTVAQTRRCANSWSGHSVF